MGIAVLAGAAVVGILAPASHAADLEVILVGVHPGAGPVNVALYTGPERFAEGEGRAKGLSLTADAPTVRAVIPDVAPGPVAVLVHHDENNNGRVDRVLGVLPVEGYGISGNPSVPAPPTWESSRFTLPEAGGAVTIEMRYPLATP